MYLSMAHTCKLNSSPRTSITCSCDVLQKKVFWWASGGTCPHVTAVGGGTARKRSGGLLNGIIMIDSQGVEVTVKILVVLNGIS